MSRPSRPNLVAAALPSLAISAFVVIVGAVVAASGTTLGYDFLAYHGAARRLLDGAAVYDLGYARAGGFGLFLYPPTFLPLILPFALLEATTATWAWLAVMTAALLLAIRLLPVPPTVRWSILLLAGLSWPVAYTIKLGQVTPVLFLLAVLGWRGLERGGRRGQDLLGGSAALGAAIKIQPGLLLAWALLTGRWRAVLAGALVLLAVAALATLAAGPGAWFDYVALIRQITDPVTTEHNVTPGWVAHGLGLSVDAANAVQLAVIGLTVAALVASIRLCTPTASYLVAVAASQLISPVLWDHYAMLLLLPTAWLLARGRRWAVIIPLATSLPLIWLTPLAAYPVAFAVTIAATMVVGMRARGGTASLPAAAAA